jgi:hypothetical protein
MKVKNAAQILLEAEDDFTNDEIDNILGLSGIDDGLRERIHDKKLDSRKHK